jgi:hypothetical protein
MKRTMNKADFIMSFSGDTPTKEIVAAGEAKGIAFSRNYVSRVRLMKRTASRGKRRAARTVAAPAARRAFGNGEATFKRLVIDLGLGRAHALFDETVRAFDRALDGEHPRESTNGSTPRRGRRRVRRSGRQIERALAAIVALLNDHKEGLGSEQIQKALAQDKRKVVRPLAHGLKTGTLKKKGEKRATVYFV